jgi:hypothetical protein
VLDVDVPEPLEVLAITSMDVVVSLEEPEPEADTEAVLSPVALDEPFPEPVAVLDLNTIPVVVETPDPDPLADR